MADEGPKQSPAEGSKQQQQRTPVGSARKIGESLFTPRFKSVAAMAGWDEEAILVASLVVEDTPDRDVKQQSKKRQDLVFKSPSSASLRRKHKTRRRSSVLIPSAVLNLDEEETPEQEKDEEKVKEKDKEKVKEKDVMNDEKTKSEKELTEQNSGDSCSKSALPCMDKLREELSCAICLDICFEPSTTSCGHSFCKQCLRSAATKCGKKCPKCRQLISGRSCPVNTVLWNTIQLLFPEEVEARKDAAKASRREEAEKNRNVEREDSNSNPRRRSVRPSRSPISIGGNAARRNFERESSISRVLRSRNGNATTRTGIVSQDNDSALALRLQREEFMVAFRESGTQSITSARENLRAMVSRAVNLRTRRHPV